MRLSALWGRPGIAEQESPHSVKGFVGNVGLVDIRDAHPLLLRHSLGLVYLVALHLAAALYQIPSINCTSTLPQSRHSRPPLHFSKSYDMIPTILDLGGIPYEALHCLRSAQGLTGRLTRSDYNLVLTPLGLCACQVKQDKEQSPYETK